jgi:hypothetical protein
LRKEVHGHAQDLLAALQPGHTSACEWLIYRNAHLFSNENPLSS